MLIVVLRRLEKYLDFVGSLNTFLVLDIFLHNINNSVYKILIEYNLFYDNIHRFIQNLY